MGETIEEAKNNALRSAIEQAFGAFISSKTEILNDNIKDEIVSISNGNIHNYNIISQIKIPDGGYAITLEATVSLNQLSSFVKSKGINVEFQGQIFGANIRQIELNQLAEEKTIDNLCKISKEILAKSLDFSLDVSDPRENEFGNYDLDFYIFSYPNKNYEMFKSFFYKTMKSISMSKVEFKNYQKINKSFYQINIQKLKNRHNKLFVFNKPSEKKKKDIEDPFTNGDYFSWSRSLNAIKDAYNIKNKPHKDFGQYWQKTDAIYLRSNISFQKLKSFLNATNELLLSFDLLSYSSENSSSKIFFNDVSSRTRYNCVPSYNIFNNSGGYTTSIVNFPIWNHQDLYLVNKSPMFMMHNLVYVHVARKSFSVSELEKIKEFKVKKK